MHGSNCVGFTRCFELGGLLAPGAVGDDTYELRQTQLHYNASGLIVMGKVGHTIYSKNPDQADRTRLTEHLGRLDWSRTSSLWQGNVMSGEKITTSRDMYNKAAAVVKKELGLDLSDRERKLLGGHA